MPLSVQIMPKSLATASFTLNEGVDFVGPEAPENPDDYNEVFQSTANDDTIEGVAASLSSANTLNAGDNLDGGEGYDTLAVDMQSNFGGFSEDGGLSNVENVELTSNSSIGRTFNATGVQDVESYTLNADEGALILSNLATAGASVEINDMESGSMSIAFDADSDVTTDTTDALAMDLNNVGIADYPDTDTDEGKVATLNINDIEELNLTSTGNNVVALGKDDAQDLTLEGTGSLKMTDVGTGCDTLGASAYEGDLEIDLLAATDATQVVTGEGDDEITAEAGSDLTVNAEINGGLGIDALNLTANGGATTQYTMAGIVREWGQTFCEE